jgi:hypothetical protein
MFTTAMHTLDQRAAFLDLGERILFLASAHNSLGRRASNGCGMTDAGPGSRVG